MAKALGNPKNIKRIQGIDPEVLGQWCGHEGFPYMISLEYRGILASFCQIFIDLDQVPAAEWFSSAFYIVVVRTAALLRLYLMATVR